MLQQREVAMRPARTIAAVVFTATIGMLTLLAAPASAASPTRPVAVHARPRSVVAGHTVTLSGSVGPDAAASDCSNLILYSDAFDPANRVGYGIAVYATAKPTGAFTATTTIPRSKTAGTFPVYLRCGGATVGGEPLVVRAAPTTPPATVQVSPRSVAAGDTVVVSGSVGPDSAGVECSGVTLLSRAFVHTYDFAGVPAVFAGVKPSGAFTATTTIPRSTPAGTYTITGRCGGENLGVSATLVVRAAASPTTTAPAPPATGPSVSQPALPAPAVTGPPTPPASRWIIPWLAALGSSTLAALGAWLVYRRRHPASLSRLGRSRMAN
jgi:hypothetical protein